MQLTSLSWMPHRPCLLLKFPNVNVLLDCAVNLETLSTFLPCTIVPSSRLEALSFPRSWGIDYLKKLNDQLFVEGFPEVQPASLHTIAVDAIDIVLVSNWMSLVGLPFITERPDFRGVVYATEPTIQLGRLVMEELNDFFEGIDRDPIDDRWRADEIWRAFPNAPKTNPKEWKKFYNKKQLDNCLKKVVGISYSETIVINGAIRFTAYSSGFAIGSANWLIETETEKIGYLSASSSRTSHAKPAQWDKLKRMDSLILTSLSRIPESSPNEAVSGLFKEVVETLRARGNVLLPIAPTGILYDLFEYMIQQVDQISRDIPVYFISPIAKSALEYANIYAEWLSDIKSNKVYKPEEPFAHSEFVKGNRLRVYENIHGNFSREYKTPCVVFTGHPCLRIGNVVHFLEMWGNDPKNVVILTDPDYPPEEVYGPYNNLQIKCKYFPIETKLDYTQVPLILQDLEPKLLMLPEQYTKPVKGVSGRDLVVAYKPQITFKHGETLSMPISGKRKRVLIDPDMLKEMNVKGAKDNDDHGVCAIRGFLSAYDNKLELISLARANEKATLPRVFPKLVGSLTAEDLIKTLKKKSITAEIIKNIIGESIVVKIPRLEAQVTISADGQKSRISCKHSENRKILHGAITQCLNKL
uniref:Beta-Casp domain-containing protein n=1 Tax=Acrobeloides nanus TaxID=290746 RepID=A0A914BWB8_9BILA